MRFPTILQIAVALRDINDSTEADIDEMVDVRLQVWPDGSWAVHSGDSQYDTDHRGFWGASSVPGRGHRFRSRDIARDLISQARDHYAESEAE